MGRILAIDYGTKRLGIAVTDEGKKMAFPRPFVAADKRGDLLRLIKSEGIERIVLGWPKSLGNRETAFTREVKKFANRINEQTGLPVELMDERLTSKAAERVLKKLGLKGRESRSSADSLAALQLLQTYLKKPQ